VNRFEVPGRVFTFAILLFVALSALCMIPSVAIIVVWFYPIPLTIFYIISRRWVASLTPIVFGILWLSGIGVLLSILLALALSCIAISHTFQGQKSQTVYADLLFSTMIFVLVELVMLAFLRWQGFDIFSLISKSIETTVQGNPTLLADKHLSVGSLVSATVHWVHLMLPSVICLVAFLLAAANLLICRVLLRFTPYLQQSFLRTWKLSYWVVILYIVSLLIVMFKGFESTYVSWQFVNNLMFLTAVALGVQGLGMVWRKVYNRIWGPVVIAFCVILSLLGIIGNIFTLIGIYDNVKSRRQN